MLDLCTGSGSLGIAIAMHTDVSHVILADISPKALAVARRNIRRHNLSSRVACVRTDHEASIDFSRAVRSHCSKPHIYLLVTSQISIRLSQIMSPLKLLMGR